MRDRTRTAIRAAVLGFLLFAGAAGATKELAKSEELVCTVCHDKPGSKLLTDKGQYFELMRSMGGYADVEASFGRCTFCHRSKPGSRKLTPAGRGFANALGGMEALVEWMKERHPGWPEISEEDGDGGDADERDEGDSPATTLQPAH